MKRILATMLAAIGFGATAQAPKAPPASLMTELRTKALAVKPIDLGLSSAVYADRPWGVLMETGLEDGTTYSLVALADGSTSLYFSSGGGVIGGGQHDAVRTEAEKMLIVAARLQRLASPTSATPLPSAGKVCFYLLTVGGILTYSAEEQLLGEGKDRMSELFYAGHSVISEVRKIEESKARARKQ
ncbi:MAG: hypothetical protein HY749_09030 [Gammaproteobacteria bacterium]|nr:hypothetical protein [Gammaproteobacteria bacterium]